MPTGTIKKWIESKAFGFIQPDEGGPDVFFHETALRDGDDIVEGAAVTYETPGQAVYEPFSGSGTTIIASEMTGRLCFAVEIDPAYVDVAVLRWQAFTGLAATMEGSGASFADVGTQRRREAKV